MVRTFPLVIVAVLLAGALCHAQPRDWRISPVNPPTHRLPDDARMQSAATIGGVTLAAWGTTFRTPEGEIANRIVARVITGNTPSSTELDLCGAEARPYGFVQVIAANTVFVILWNDRRSDAPGIYTRRIGPDGAPASASLRIDSGLIVPDSTATVMLLGSRALGQLALLQIARNGGGLFAWRFTDAGLSQGAPRRLGDGLLQALTVATLPGQTLLRLAAGRPVLVDNAGRINSDPIRGDLFNAPFHLAADSSLLRIAGDTLQYCRSLFDTLPFREVRVPALDSATANTKHVWRDSAGSAHLFFATLRNKPGYIVTTGFDVRVDSNGDVAPPLQRFVHTDHSGPSSYDLNNYSTYSLTGTAWSPGCAGTAHTVVSWQVTPHVHGNGQPSYAATSFISLGADGRYRYGDSGYVGSCIARAPLPLERLSDTSRSAVRIRLGGDIIELSSEPALRDVDLPEHSPVAGVRGGMLLAGWIARGINDTMMIGRWSPGSMEPASSLHRVTIPSRPEYTIDQLHLGLSYQRGDALTSMNGALGLAANFFMAESRRVYPTQASYYSTSIITAGSRLYLPDTNGWRSVMATSDGPLDTYNDGRKPMRQMDVRGYDPNRNEYLIAIKRTDSYSSSSIYQIIPLGIADTGSAPAWTLDTLGGARAEGPMIPLDYRAVMQIPSDTMAVRLTGGGKVDTIMLPRTPGRAAYMRLLGRRFLRWYWDDSLMTVLRLDLFDLDGALLAWGRTAASPASKEVSVVQSRYDSSIAVVHADSNGIHATLFDDMLAVVRSDALISATRTASGTPSAVFLRDTLCALWSDTRNGGFDIYGGMLAGMRKAGVEERGAGRITTARIAPVPARDRAYLQFQSSARGVLVLDLVDMKGRTVCTERLDLEEGPIEHELALDKVPSGPYLLRYRIGRDAGWLRIVVAR